MGGQGDDRKRLVSCDYLSVSIISSGWQSMTPLLKGRSEAAAVCMAPRGRILLVGGRIDQGDPLDLELYTPAPTGNGDWSPVGQWSIVATHFECMYQPRFAVMFKDTVVVLGK